ncbi:MAG TPA: ligase-associated DNA damage response exonuclease, partial [Alphaproteobacteria bacterium]|nr:ligase-associated DNA damage response exonuclease [Alphaproteobacteria bacterium]
MAVDELLQVTPAGLYCPAADLYIDPVRKVPRAVITHGHSDHARPGHGAVLATAETLAIMRARMGRRGPGDGQTQALGYGEVLRLGGVELSLVPAGHILGSAQVVLTAGGRRAVVSGDYKRRRDPSCAGFELVPCDLFVTEATFALPVFRHPADAEEVGRLLHSLSLFPERCHIVGVYSLGKAQRLLLLLREAGHDAPVLVHDSIARLNEVYESFGAAFGDVRPLERATDAELAGRIVLAPPGGPAGTAAARTPEPVIAMASGWMGVRAHARRRGVELPLVISDHADWDELTATLDDVGAPEIWVTHGRDDALERHLALRQRRGRRLGLTG